MAQAALAHLLPLLPVVAATGQIAAGFPRGVRLLRGQLQVKDGAALAAGVQVLALHQRPGGAGGGGGTGGVGQGAGIQVQRGGQGVLPVGQGGSGVAGLVGLKAFVQWLGLLGV